LTRVEQLQIYYATIDNRGRRTEAPPKQVKPAAGVFLELAPINRRYDIPYSQQAGRT